VEWNDEFLLLYVLMFKQQLWPLVFSLTS